MQVTSRRIVAAAAACLLAFSAHANRYVNPVTGNDAGPNACQNPSTPCKTLTHAMSQAGSGTSAIADVIELSPGTYGAATGEVFPINVKPGVRIAATDDTHRALIDAGGANTRIFIVNAGAAPVEIEGLVIQGAHRDHNDQAGDAYGGAIWIQSGTQVLITRNLFRDNLIKGTNGVALNASGGHAWGGAVGSGFCPASTCSPTLVNNVFIDNSAIGGAGGVAAGDGAPSPGGNALGGAVQLNAGTVSNNTFYGNAAAGGAGATGTSATAAGGSAQAGAVFVTSGTVANNIFVGNEVQAGSGAPAGTVNNTALWQFSGVPQANLFFGNQENGSANDAGNTTGAFSLAQDPLFQHAPDNLRIGFNSPAAGTGTEASLPAIDFDGMARGTPATRGAFEPSGYRVVPTDLNGDSRSDMLWRNALTGQVHRMLMNGTTITNSRSVYAEPNTAWKIVSDADFNADGTSDALWRNGTTGQLYLLTFNAAGVPSGGRFVYTEPNAAWKLVATPDLDGNQHADLLWWNASTGQVFAVLLQAGQRLGDGFVYREPNTNWKILGACDFAGSGRANQVAWYNGQTGQVYLMTVQRSNGAFTQTGKVIYNEPNTAWKLVAVHDFTGDQRCDLLWRNATTGQVYLVRMGGADGSQVEEGRALWTEPDTAWNIVAVGDYNGDGRGDLLWRHDTTGQVFVLFGNGMTVLGGGLVYSEPNENWRLLGFREYAAPQ